MKLFFMKSNVSKNVNNELIKSNQVSQTQPIQGLSSTKKIDYDLMSKFYSDDYYYDEDYHDGDGDGINGSSLVTEADSFNNKFNGINLKEKENVTCEDFRELLILFVVLNHLIYLPQNP